MGTMAVIMGTTAAITATMVDTMAVITATSAGDSSLNPTARPRAYLRSRFLDVLAPLAHAGRRLWVRTVGDLAFAPVMGIRGAGCGPESRDLAPAANDMRTTMTSIPSASWVTGAMQGRGGCRLQQSSAPGH
ncbi:hypothetical protein J3R73_000957 [Labrys monachus]|uniref:Secreted protein n=1 Tax=Labrys monachus TaxID=217067 RepID=A0ABU0F977_9HYPH|nr:hypothetical protein [Labrys monachus]